MPFHSLPHSLTPSLLPSFCNIRDIIRGWSIPTFPPFEKSIRNMMKVGLFPRSSPPSEISRIQYNERMVHSLPPAFLLYSNTELSPPSEISGLFQQLVLSYWILGIYQHWWSQHVPLLPSNWNIKKIRTTCTHTPSFHAVVWPSFLVPLKWTSAHPII